MDFFFLQTRLMESWAGYCLHCALLFVITDSTCVSSHFTTILINVVEPQAYSVIVVLFLGFIPRVVYIYSLSFLLTPLLKYPTQ